MSPVAHMKKAAWRFGCLACNLLNLFLFFLATGLGGLVFLNWFQQEVPIPDKLARWVINKAGPDHLESTWSKALFDLRAGLYLKGYKLSDSATEQTILTADEAYLKWSPLHIIFPGLPPLKEVNARNIRIYVPVSHSPSGLNEPVLGIKHIYSKESNGDVSITSLLLETGGLRVLLDGEAPLDAILRPGKGDRIANPYSILQSLRRLPANLRADLTVSWEMLPSGDHVFELSGFLPDFEYRDIQMEKLVGKARIFYSEKGLAVRGLSLDGIVTYAGTFPEIPILRLPEEPVPVPFKLRTGGSPWRYRDTEFPSSLFLSLHPRDNQLHFQRLLLQTNLNDQLDSPLNWILDGPSAFATGIAVPRSNGNLSGLLQLPGRYSARIYVPDCSVYQFLSAPLPHRLLVGAKARDLRINATFNKEELRLAGSLVTDNLNIGQTNFDHLYANLQLDPELLLLENIKVQKNSIEEATGSYLHEFPTSRFSLNAAGSIFPSSLDTILGQWWINIFTHIEATRTLPGDVTVWGHWRDADSLQSVTEVHGPGAKYRGLEIPNLELRVRSNNKWAYLDHLHATFPDGEMQGTIAIRSGLGPEEPYRTHVLNLKSDAPWEALLQATGLDALNALQFAEGNPHLTVKGLLWRDSGNGFETGQLADLELSLVQHSGNCNLGGLIIEGLTVDGTVDGNYLGLERVSGKFADGVFSGSISLNSWNDPARQSKSINLSLFDAQFDVARQQLSNFIGLDDNGLNAEDGAKGGRLTADIILQSGPAKTDREGYGRVAIRESKLGTVHLFGGLSRVLGGMGLGFTTLELNSLALDWKVDGAALLIQNGLVTGPSLKLTLQGEMDLDSKTLNMVSDVTLFSGFFSKVFSPVSETLQFDLGGTFDRPTWGIRFNPFRWALNRVSSPPPSAKPAN